MDGTPTYKIGNVTRAPELRYSDKDGKHVAFAKFGLAHTPYVNGANGETQFYDVTCFGSLAENVAECVQKGHRVVVSGLGKVETFTGQDGIEKSKKVIVADGVGPDLRFVVADLRKPASANVVPAAPPTAVQGFSDEAF